MSKMVHTKRIAAGHGKKPKWVITSRGPHPKKESIPLMMIVRDILGHAKTAREAERIISNALIMVDKKPVKDPNRGVGLMDVIEIPKIKKYYRVMPGRKGLYLKEIDKKESEIKLCRIKDKSLVSGGKTQLNLHDGSNILVEEDKYKTRDTIVLKLPQREIIDSIGFKKGNMAVIVHGRHSGEVGKISEILEGSKLHKSLTKVESIQTRTDYLFMIGEKKAIIAV